MPGWRSLGRRGWVLRKKRQIFGKEWGLGAACYPGSASVKVYARALYDHTVDYIKADMTGAKQ